MGRRKREEEGYRRYAMEVLIITGAEKKKGGTSRSHEC